MVDLSDVDAAVQLVHDAWDAFGGLDCLVNNAALGKRKVVTDHTAEDLEVVMRTNFMSPIRMNLAVLPLHARARLGDDRERRQRRRPVRDRARVGLLRREVRHDGMDRGGGHGPGRHAHRGEADPARRHRHRDLGPLPGELPGLPGAEFATAQECAAGIVDALETDGVEFFVPAELKAHVDMKNSDLQGWIDLMVSLGHAKETSTTALSR